jgi:Kef-type K+ transport system membrane component KefB
MHLTANELFLAALLMIFALPYLVWRLLGERDWAPVVVVQIMAGLVMGPGILGAIWPGGYESVFTSDTIATLNGVAALAVILFVWLAGLELDLHGVKQNWREAGLVAGLALVVPLVLGGLAGAFLMQWPMWQGAQGQSWQVLLGFGMASAVTALPILVLFLEQLGLLRAAFGQRVLRFASLDDIAIWSVLALILLDGDRILRQSGFILVFALAALLIRRVIAALPERDRWFVGLIWLFACALGADWSGLHYMVGAFLAGVVLDRQLFGEARVDLLRANVLMVLMPVFFMSTGLRTTWEAGGLHVFLAGALLLVASVGGKLAGVALAGRILGWKRGEAALVGWLLQTKAPRRHRAGLRPAR